MPQLQGFYQQPELYQKLLEIVEHTDTGRVMLRSGQRLATLFIANKQIVDAVLGLQKGAEAFEALLAWTEGEYRFSPGMVSQTPSLDLPLAALQRVPEAIPTPITTVVAAPTLETTELWTNSAPGVMVGNLKNVDIINLLRVLCNVGQSGLLRLRPKDEARIYIAGGTITFAAYQQMRGMQALSEIALWKTDSFRFENGLTSQETNLSLPLSQILEKMGEQIESKSQRDTNTSGAMYFYSLPVPQGTQISPLGLEIIQNADGTSFEELVQNSKGSSDAIASEIKTLLDLKLIYTESSPSTPKILRSIKPQFLENKGFFGAKPKLKLSDLSSLELAVYDQIDGGRTLWDIRVNLQISRQEVWAAYNRLLEGVLITSKPA